jgi:hypothetical protein
VLIATILPRGGFPYFGTTPGDDEVQRQALNAMIRANAAKADAVLDFAADKVMGSYTANADQRYYGDATHPTSLGDAYLAADAAAAINAMTGQTGTKSAPGEGLGASTGKVGISDQPR